MLKSFSTVARRKSWKPPRLERRSRRDGHAVPPLAEGLGAISALSWSIYSVCLSLAASSGVGQDEGRPEAPPLELPCPPLKKRSAASGRSRSRLALRAAMLSLLRLRFLRSRATRMPEIPPCRRRDADFSDALHLPKDAPALVSRRGGAVAVRRVCGATRFNWSGTR